MVRQTISIIGAGISGLTLSRCLLHRGIPAVIYERTASAAPHNYAITLHESSYRPLLQFLGVSEQNFKARVAVDTASPAPRNNGDAATPGTTGGGSFRAHRGRLEAWLREPSDVRWGHALASVHMAGGGDGRGATLKFENGVEVRGDVVVGSDGPHSRLRQELLPECGLRVLPIAAYNGKRRFDRGVFDKSIRAHFQGSYVADLEFGDSRLRINIDDVGSERVSTSWIYSRPSRRASDPLDRPGRAQADAAKIPEELFAELGKFANAAGESELLTTILDANELCKDRILHWLMRTVLVPEKELMDMARTGVVLLGDAVHAEPIIGGNGANMAIEDAVLLADQLAIANQGATPDLSRWIGEQYSRWEDSVRIAESIIDTLHSPASERTDSERGAQQYKM